MSEEEIFDCPVCGEWWNHVAVENQAELTGKPVSEIMADFSISGCPVLGLPHLRMGHETLPAY